MPLYRAEPDIHIGYVANIDPRFGGIAAAAITASTIYVGRLPRVTKPKLLTSIDVHIGAAAGNVAAGLMTTTDAVATTTQALAATYTRVAHTGEVLAAGSNVWQSLPLAAPYLYLPDTDLWVAFGGDNGSCTAGRNAGTAAVMAADGLNMSKASAYSSGIPATLTTLAGNAAVFCLKVRW